MFKIGDRVRMLWPGPPVYAVLSEPNGCDAWWILLFDMPDGRPRRVTVRDREFIEAPLECCPCCGQVKPGQMRLPGSA